MPSIITKHQMDIADRKDIENSLAEREELQAIIDYNIMMGNFEDPAEEEEME